MKPFFCFLFSILLCGLHQAQDTFSIVAVDSVTGEVGGAGASCLDSRQVAGGVLIINDILPDRGVIHTQSYWVSANQTRARNRMLFGDTPSEIITWLQANDVASTPAIRQYGIAAFDTAGSPLSAAFTGSNCLDQKGHIIGPGYAIQGNILIDTAVLDSMEARFLRTSGSLADRLMAALQGANIPGADSRCLSEGVSSLSAFIRVARKGESTSNMYLDLVVDRTPFGVEPIDSLQKLFDQWKHHTSVQTPLTRDMLHIYQPHPEEVVFRLQGVAPPGSYVLKVYNALGQCIWEEAFGGPSLTLNRHHLRHRGLYLWSLSRGGKHVQHGKVMF